MKIRLVLGLLLLQFHLTIGQDVTLDDLAYFQATKSSIKIDSVLLTKTKWDCNCSRKYDRIDWNKEWTYDVNDTTKEDIEKDYIKINEVDREFSSIVTFYTTDKRKADIILNEILARKFKEEKIQTLGNGTTSAKISFYVSDKFAIQTVIGKNKEKELEKYAFVFMDKADYLKGLTIK